MKSHVAVAERSSTVEGPGKRRLRFAARSSVPHPNSPCHTLGLPFSFGEIPLFSPGEYSAHAARSTEIAPLTWPIQPKLQIGSVDDPLEREADSIAERAMFTSAPTFPPATAGTSQEQQTISRNVSTAVEGLNGVATPAVVRDALRSPGQPLDADARSFFEPRFGYSFDQVRIHADTAGSESAAALDARAYTLGSHVVFADGHYQPWTLPGRRLLAHELAHVVQQTRNPAPVVRRKQDALKKYTTKQIVADRDAAAIDLALAQSPTITRYVKDLKKEKGHIDTEPTTVFNEKYRKYATEELKNTPDEIKEALKTVAGFTSRKAGIIYLKSPAILESALHEAVHLNSASTFQTNFGHALNEGVTQHFTQSVLTEQGLAPGEAYPDELAMAEALIKDLHEEEVGKAYFQGKTDAYQKVIDAFNKSRDIQPSTWKGHAGSSNHEDWKLAAQELHRVLTGPPRSTVPATTPGQQQTTP